MYVSNCGEYVVHLNSARLILIHVPRFNVIAPSSSTLQLFIGLSTLFNDSKAIVPTK